MSGGRWNYMSFRLEDRARRAGEVWRLMAAVEHEMDWAVCSDTCRDCCRLRVFAALEAFFDSRCADATAAIAIVRDHDQNLCDEDKERAARRITERIRLERPS